MTRTIGVLALLGIVGGCATGGDGLDTRSVEAVLEDELYPDASFEVTGARCPEPAPRGFGEEVECTVRVGDAEVVVVVRQIDDEGTVVLEPVSTVLDRVALEETVAGLLTDEVGVEMTADCGTEPAILTAVGEQIPCEGVDAQGNRGPVTVTVTSESGDVEVAPT